MAPSHYLNRYWFIICKFQCLIAISQVSQLSITKMSFKTCTSKICSYFPGFSELNIIIIYHPCSYVFAICNISISYQYTVSNVKMYSFISLLRWIKSYVCILWFEISYNWGAQLISRYIHDFRQDCGMSSTLIMKIPQSCIKPLICLILFYWLALMCNMKWL